jgi:hypothetical protein
MFDAGFPYSRNWLRYDQRTELLQFFNDAALELSKRLVADPTRNEVGLTDELSLHVD